MWHIGLDIGGTHVDCLAMDDNGSRLELHRNRPIGDLPEEVVPQMIADFISESRIKPSQIELIAAGWKHGRNPKRVKEMIGRFAKLHLRSKIFWDAEVAFTGALPERVGLIVLSGTGSVVYGKDAKGHVWFGGGWSPLLGDPGSSFFIGQQALVAALRDQEKVGPSTRLTEAIIENLHCGLGDLIVLADSSMDEAVPTIASIAVSVFNLASEGDAEAVRIRDEAAKHLVERVKAVAGQWPSGEELVLSYAGRLMYGQPEFRQYLQRLLSGAGLDFRWREPHFRPPAGSLLVANPSLLPMLDKFSQSLDWHH